MNNNKEDTRKKTSCSIEDTGSTQNGNLILSPSFSENFNLSNSFVTYDFSKKGNDNDNLLAEKIHTCGNRRLIEWSEEENILLFDKFVEVGSKWVELSRHIPTKSDNAIKNRFYCCLRKVQKRINKIQKEKKKMIKRMISFDSLLTILEIGKFGSNSNDRRFDEISLNSEKIIEVRDEIVAFAKKPEKHFEDEDFEGLIFRCLDFKHSLKFLNIDRVKKSAKKSMSMAKTETSPLANDSIMEELPFNWSEIAPVEEIKMEDNDLAHILDVEGLKLQLLNEPIRHEEISLMKSCEDVLNETLRRENMFDEYLM